MLVAAVAVSSRVSEPTTRAATTWPPWPRPNAGRESRDRVERSRGPALAAGLVARRNDGAGLLGVPDDGHGSRSPAPRLPPHIVRRRDPGWNPGEFTSSGVWPWSLGWPRCWSWG